jgi:Flp pilus assembly protein TadD
VFLAEAATRLAERDTMGWPPIGPNDRDACADLVISALKHAGGDAIVLALCGHALLHLLKDAAWAMSVNESAMDANPNNFLVVVFSSISHLHCGNVADAVTGFHRAIELSPRDLNLHVSLTGIAHAHMILDEFEAALTWAIRSMTVNPTYPCTFWMVIAANAQLGRMDEARRHLAQFLKLQPGITIARIRRGQPDKDPHRLAAILDGMRLAGLPEA